MPRTIVALLLPLLVAIPQLPHDPPKPLIPPFKLSTPPQPPPTDDLHDDSDWFSLLRPMSSEAEEAANAVPTQERQIPSSNFRILGIDFTSDFFEAARHRFGQIHKVNRGDAHYGRTQACYVSAASPSKIYLILEGGEVDVNLTSSPTAPTGTAATAASALNSLLHASPPPPVFASA